MHSGRSVRYANPIPTITCADNLSQMPGLASLLQYEDGTPVSPFELRSRFDKARRLAGVPFQFRDIRAKAASDTGDLAYSQELLGHLSRNMTKHYIRSRIGERVRPVR